VDGISYTAPVSIAAGFDKDLKLIEISPSLGTGFHTIWSLTAKPYEGNPGPWLVRLPSDSSILVNYGLKNKGIDIHIPYLKKIQEQGLKQPLRISIAKTNCSVVCDMNEAISDYCYSLEQLHKHNIGSAYEINISCPNAFGGEDFSKADQLDRLLHAIKNIGITKPLYLKMPVDSSRDQYKAIIDVAMDHKISGIIISNLTKQRDLLHIQEQEKIQNISWWLSGRPCFAIALSNIAKSYEYIEGRMTIIGCGGIFSAQDAYDMISHGASLLQLITWMIFQWPTLFAEINSGLDILLQRDGFTNISDAVGWMVKGKK
jgi:dihydroorotate dehydrogenase